MTGFETGREYYRVYKKGNNGKSVSWDAFENPFDPSNTEYEDFWDGWVHERDNS